MVMPHGDCRRQWKQEYAQILLLVESKHVLTTGVFHLVSFWRQRFENDQKCAERFEIKCTRAESGMKPHASLGHTVSVDNIQ
jgi:hypothetical protein